MPGCWIAKKAVALCLAKDGEKLPFRIAKTPEKFAIEWNATYQIEGDKFVVIQNSGIARTIIPEFCTQLEFNGQQRLRFFQLN